MKAVEKIKNHLTEVIRIKKSPHSIAFGFATGLFLGSLPIPGFGVFLALAITLIYPRISKL